MNKLLYLMCFALLVGCSTAEYKDDIGFLNSAQANSFELVIKVAGGVCRDMDNIPGLCSKRWPINKDFVISVVPLQYNSNVSIICTSALDYNVSRSVPVNTPVIFTIPVSKYNSLKSKSFTCIVEVFNQEIPIAVSSKAEVKVELLDPNYVPRESAYLISKNNKHTLVMGRYSKYVTVCSNGHCRNYTEAPTLEVEGPHVQAYSESYQGRWNYYHE